MQKIVIGIIAALAIIGVGSFVLLGHSNTSPAADTSAAVTNSVTTTTTTTTTSTSTTPVSTTKTYTLADVAKHHSAASCWTAINGKVYDVTSWIPQHPGGQAHILALCGTDGSDAFNGQHGGQARPASELATFYIADLAQ